MGTQKGGETMEEYQLHRNILCIDLKSFYASVECSLRGFDPFKTPLVVADKSRGKGAITLAVTPFLKKLGIPSRCRIYDIPENLRDKIIFARPQMKTYMEYSMKIVEIYLSFISEEDLYVYSIDEAFLDVTSYLNFYQMTDVELAKKIVDKISNELHLPSSCGIGPNMIMAKMALDIDSKKAKDSIAKWTYEDIPTKLWPVKPISEMWGIGNRMAHHLNLLGLETIGDIAHYDKALLKRKFGVIGEELWYHTHGIDMSILQDKNKLRAQNKSYGHSQILFRNYHAPEIYTIILEMADEVTRRLRIGRKKCRVIHFGAGYSKDMHGGLHKQVTLDRPTSSFKIIYDTCVDIFNEQYDGSPVRSIGISLGGLTENDTHQFSLFEDLERDENEYQLLASVDEIKMRYGKNAVNRGSSLNKESTIRERNGFVGGHHE